MSWTNKINDYGIIENLKVYMENKYPGSEYITGRNLELKGFIQKDFREKNNCVITSITRVIDYHRGNLPIIPEDQNVIYSDVLEIARDNMFSEIMGVFPNKISAISRTCLKGYGIDSRCKGIYFGNFYSVVVSQIDQKNPLLMNIALGKYSSHTVTVVGYSIYGFKNMKIKIIHILDGWSRNTRYLDYSDFSHSIFSVNAASFNIIEPKID